MLLAPLFGTALIIAVAANPLSNSSPSAQEKAAATTTLARSATDCIVRAVITDPRYGKQPASDEHRARLLGDDGFHWPIGDLARDHRLGVRGRCPGGQRQTKNCVGDLVSHRELHDLRVGRNDPSMPTQRAATLCVPV